MRNIEFWKAQNLFNMASTRALPESIDLLPANHQAAVEHARRLSPDGSLELSSAFDHLRSARTEIQIMRDAHQTSPQFYTEHAQKASRYLDVANTELDAVAQYLRQAVTHQVVKN
jgi:hypothetical protein